MTGSRPKVVYWNNQPSPYHVARLNAVADRGNLEVIAWFDAIREPDRSWQVDPETWRFPARVLEARRVGGRLTTLPIGELHEARPDLLVSLYDRPRLVAGLLAGRAACERIAVRCLPPSEAWSTPGFGSQLGTRFVFRMIDFAKCSGADAVRFARANGLPEERTQIVTQAIDVDTYRQALAIPEADRESVRAAMGLAGCVFLYVGRIWSGKGIETLLAAYRRVRTASPEPTTLLLVGDGADEARFRRETAELGDVVWGGFIQPLDLPRIYRASDVFVFPTLGDPHGLVIDEAMAAGLPVVTSDAAGDVASRVASGVTGYVVPAADVEALADAMLMLASDPPRRADLARSAARRSTEVALDRYAEDFERFVERCLAAPRRRTASAVVAGLAGRTVLRLPGARRTASRSMSASGAGSDYDTDHEGLAK